ncbi:beta-1,4-N-acetylgalactosaminyltransferase bre-4 isoform X2 [Anopheles stephensi]|uniref:beta-1,4-N-acetylgalactosaminyltransferase bre-4 isoform X2 n=1 Tax=Anopheles stephensi TaxID=30069 RepID=UPI001658800C|nr:beta-1,4-N-acetylgalactosaminyltransferase bre-4 isoform X2 [Anopheles stephensi]
MAFCNRTLAIKAALGAGFLLILLNLLNSKLDSGSGTGRYSSHLKTGGATQWPKRTHGSLESHSPSSSAMVGNDRTESTNGQQQHNNDGQPMNNDSFASPPPPLPDHSADGERNQASSADDRTGTAQHNNPEIKHVIQNHAHEPTKRTATVSEQYELTDDKQNGSNISSIVTPSASAGSSQHSHFSSNSIDNVGNISGIHNVKSEKASGNKSMPEAAVNNNVQNSSTLLPAPKPENAANVLLPRVYDDDDEEAREPDRGSDLSDKFTINSCPPIPPNLDGPIDVDVLFEPISAVEKRFASKLQPGGQYVPPGCTARNRVAIIVPYRDREQHLPIFLKNIHALLMKQQLEYGIYIVEQTAGSSFNRAALMNIGFVEAMKQKSWECMVFHDIDLLPMDDRNLYTCPDQPRHMSVAVDTFGFKLPYSTIFGGVSAMTEKQFRMVNGFSNSFWGWGGEDDDMSNRLKHVGFHIARYPVNIARYTMLNHKKEKANPKRYEKLVNGAKRFDSDGLNSLHYQLVNLIRKPLYTWIHAAISPDGS